MENIYIGFSYPKKFKLGAKAISVWMNRPYSHVYIRFESSKLPSNVYHAAHGMVHFREFENFKKENNIIKEYKIQVTSTQKLDVLIKSIQLAGEVYGYSELGKIFISDIFYNITEKEIKFNNGKGYICSELVAKICENDLGIKFNKPKHLLKPSHIDEELENKNLERTV